MQANNGQIQGASLKLDVSPAKASNTVDADIRRTEGEATLANFFVPRRSQSNSSRLASRFANFAQGRTRQLRKENI